MHSRATLGIPYHMGSKLGIAGMSYQMGSRLPLGLTLGIAYVTLPRVEPFLSQVKPNLLEPITYSVHSQPIATDATAIT